MPKNTRDLLLIAAVLSVAAAVGVSSMVFAFAYRPSLGTNGAYANGPFQPGGMMGGWSQLSRAQLGSLAVSIPLSAVNGTLTFAGDSFRILVLMGPMADGRSMYSFVIDNFTNPTLVFPRGARVTMFVVNTDTDAYHGLTLTNAHPPYAYYFMPMMMNSLASTGMLPPSSSGYPSQQISFTVSEGMYYVCPVPGHAQRGMYGQIGTG